MFHANAWGLALRGGARRRGPGHARPLPAARAAVPADRGRAAHHRRGRADDLDRGVRHAGRTAATCPHCAWSCAAARPSPPALIEDFQKRTRRAILQAWGMTETIPLGTVARPPAAVSDGRAWHDRDTQGRPVRPVEVRIVETAGTVLPWDGETVGEVQVRGPWITGVVLQDDDPGDVRRRLAADRRRRDHRPAGLRALTDRAKDVIKSGGEWISSVELENTLMASSRGGRGGGHRRPRREVGRAPARPVVVREGATVSTKERKAHLPTRYRGGSSRNGGRLSRRCRRPAWGSSPRPGSGRRTRPATTRWSRSRDGFWRLATSPPGRPQLTLARLFLPQCANCFGTSASSPVR